jgi:integrase
MTHPNLPTPIQLTNGDLYFDAIEIDNIRMKAVHVSSRAALFNLADLLDRSWALIREAKSRAKRTRYAQTLPLKTPGRKISIEASDFVNDMVRRALKPTSVNSAARSLKILRLTCGDIPVDQVTPSMISEFFNVLRWAPPDITSNIVYESMTSEQIIKLGQAMGVPAPAHATQSLHQRWLTTFFKRLEKMQVVVPSPLTAFKLPKASLLVSPDHSRLLSKADIAKIFDPKSFIAWATLPHRWWAPILGLYTGARINEVAQLHLNDVIFEQGQWCISIRMTHVNQSLKGKSAVRKIPLHPDVIQAGFLDFVQDMKACGHPRLFPHLSSGVNRKSGQSNTRYSQGLANQFSDYLKGLGFAKGVGFHGFRHTLATELHAAGVTPQDIALITGHSLAKSAPVLQTHYIHQGPSQVLNRQTAALTLFNPGITLPVYRPGQFASKLHKSVKMYP